MITKIQVYHTIPCIVYPVYCVSFLPRLTLFPLPSVCPCLPPIGFLPFLSFPFLSSFLFFFFSLLSFLDLADCSLLPQLASLRSSLLFSSLLFSSLSFFLSFFLSYFSSPIPTRLWPHSLSPTPKRSTSPFRGLRVPPSSPECPPLSTCLFWCPFSSFSSFPVLICSFGMQHEQRVPLVLSIFVVIGSGVRC
jgi:hypothetical protein